MPYDDKGPFSYSLLTCPKSKLHRKHMKGDSNNEMCLQLNSNFNWVVNTGKLILVTSIFSFLENFLNTVVYTLGCLL